MSAAGGDFDCDAAGCGTGVVVLALVLRKLRGLPFGKKVEKRSSSRAEFFSCFISADFFRFCFDLNGGDEA